jgi:uncharacterized membrane protein
MEFFIYRLIVYIHVVSVILAIGPFFILLPFVRKLKEATGNELNIYLDAFRFVVRLSKHSGHVLVATGVLLVFLGPWSWGTSWIVMTLVLMFSSIFFLARGFTPTLQKLAVEDENREVLTAKVRRAIWTYILLLMTMLYFMVTKPTLW